MVKIKVKKKMNFLELVQWVWDNNKFDNFFRSNNGSYVQFDTDGDIASVCFIKKSDLFTVTVEEEVTKYSEIPNLVELYDLETGKGPETLIHQNALVNNFIENESVIALYAMNDDYTLTLLWTREGGMVE